MSLQPLHIFFLVISTSVMLTVDAVRENIVFVLTDDQDTLMGFSTQPKTQDILLRGGAELVNAFASTPVCCPSRGGIQTGRYIHNIPMTNNSLSGNCSGEAWRVGPEKHNFASLLHDAGYRTFYGGKYLNQYGFPDAGGLSKIPPGWDDWQALQGNSVYYNYKLSNNGQPEVHGSDTDKDYLPKVLQRKAMAFLSNVTESMSSTQSPFFLMIGTPSCHDPTEPAAEYASLLNNITAPRPPNYANYSQDKHWLVKNQGRVAGNPTFSKLEESYTDLHCRRRALTLLTVDDIVGNITSFLKSKGLLDNTYFFYTSDHGYHNGQFSLLKDKRQPYDFDIRVPFAVRGPGVRPGSKVSEPVVLIDLAPTFLEIAGLSQPNTMDGRSFLSAIKSDSTNLADPAGSEATKTQARVDFLIEYHGEGRPASTPVGTCKFPNMDCAQAGPEMDVHPPFWNKSAICYCQDAHNNTFECVRTLDLTGQKGRIRTAVDSGQELVQSRRNWLYCQFSSGFEEFYDLDQDPWQRHNQIDTVSPEVLSQQRQRLGELKTCQGPSCNQ